MARRLKVFRTHLGFYDMIVAAPSQKAAAQAWGADPHLFAQGFAKITTDPELVKAALDKPGVVLRRQFGSDVEFSENASLIFPPPLSPEGATDRREREQHAATEAERAERKAAKEQAYRATAADRMERAEQRSIKERERKEEAADREERRAARERAKAEAARRRDEERAAARRRQDLQAQLKLLLRQREDQLRDIESCEKALAAERRKTEQHFETQILAVRRQMEEA
jgi:colicin import membrane protein